MNFFSWICRVINNYVNDQKRRIQFRRRAKRTSQLREQSLSDIGRWEKNEELHENWNERTAILASMVPEHSHVIEFGAGNRFLEKLLPSSCAYTPTDICERYPGMLVCDLNQKIQINLENYDTAVFSGVLEYVYNIEDVLNQIGSEIDKVILSYACSDISNAPRLERGWLSDFTKTELETIFKRNNLQVIDYKEWRKQSIFYLKKAK